MLSPCLPPHYTSRLLSASVLVLPFQTILCITCSHHCWGLLIDLTRLLSSGSLGFPQGWLVLVSIQLQLGYIFLLFLAPGWWFSWEENCIQTPLCTWPFHPWWLKILSLVSYKYDVSKWWIIFFSFMGDGTDSWIWGRISCIKRATWLPYPLETVVYMCIRVRASGQLWVSFSETPSPSQRWSLSLMSSSLLIRLDWLVSEPQESSYLCLHTAGIASTCHHIIQFCVCSGNQTKVLVLVNQTLPDWAIFQVPFLNLLLGHLTLSLAASCLS